MHQVDIKILSLLQDYAGMTRAEISRQIGMVPSAVLERIRKLEENGFIQEYSARLNPELLHLDLLAFIFVRTSESPGSIGVSETLEKIPEVLEIHHVAGEDCYLLKVRLQDNKSLAAFMRKKIGGISEVTSTRTVIVLETIKESSKIKLPDPVNTKSETKP
ncbi:MAG: Lrp/AsnC family transcriptional regulator [bacterium]|nr:MAG: Lrp/AsnC family transcriptional regulator [bacterium]